MEQKIHFHVYSSSAVKPFSVDELVVLLERAKSNNSKVGLTGLLIHKDGKFMQLVEGPKEVVNSIIKKIAGDPRHKDMTTLLEGSSDGRQFSEWSMGFRDLNSPEVRSLFGYSEFLNSPLDGTEFKTSPSRSQRLLLMFKKA
jgi:hypothetical protein